MSTTIFVHPRSVLTRTLSAIATRTTPRFNLCRHREWTKFGTYSEQMLCRLLDDLC